MLVPLFFIFPSSQSQYLFLPAVLVYWACTYNISATSCCNDLLCALVTSQLSVCYQNCLKRTESCDRTCPTNHCLHSASCCSLLNCPEMDCTSLQGESEGESGSVCLHTCMCVHVYVCLCVCMMFQMAHSSSGSLSQRSKARWSPITGVR